MPSSERVPLDDLPPYTEEDEERKALLVGETSSHPEGRRYFKAFDDVEDNRLGWFRTCQWTKAKKSTYLALAISAIFAVGILTALPSSCYFGTAGGLLSNGTHDFQKTVLIVSIDGLR